MTVLTYVAGVVVFVLGLGASIALHELGHLIPAKRFGVRVPQYMIGFGPTIWSRKRGETEYGLKAFPVGGYVRMIGMFPPRGDENPGTVRATTTGRFSLLAEEARKAASEEMLPGDEDRVFYKLPVRKKLVIMTGGIVTNLLIATVLIGLMVTLHGIRTQVPGAVVATVAECVVPADQAATKTTCTPSDPKTPAYLAGLKPGDEIVSIDGTPVTSSVSVGDLIRPRVGEPTTIVVDRSGRQLTLTATPIRNTLPAYDSQGNPVVGADGKQKTVEAGFLGVSSTSKLGYERQPITAVPGIVGESLYRTVGAVVQIPQKMVAVYRAAFGGQQRSVDSPMSVVGAGRVAGEAASGQLSTLVGKTPGDAFFFLIYLLATLNMMLFVFNLVPLLPFDGGQAAGAVWEGIKRGWARLRGKPSPGFVDVAKAMPLTYAMSIVLVAMTLLLTYADIVNPINLGG